MSDCKQCENLHRLLAEERQHRTEIDKVLAWAGCYQFVHTTLAAARMLAHFYRQHKRGAAPMDTKQFYHPSDECLFGGGTQGGER